METLKSWAIGLLWASLFCGTANLLSPDKKYDQLIRFIGAMALLSILLKLISGFSDFEIVNPDYLFSESENEYTDGTANRLEQETLRLAEKQLEKELKHFIQSHFGCSSTVQLSMHVYNGRAAIASLEILLPASMSSEKSRVEKLLEEKLMTDISVKTAGEEVRAE